MGDIFQVLIFIGLIVYVVFKQLNKKPADGESVNMPEYPEFEEEPEDVTPSPFLTTDMPASLSNTRQTAIHKQGHSYQRLRIKEQSPLLSEPEVEYGAPEINIGSVEEVRKAIIWSEILNRKY